MQTVIPWAVIIFLLALGYGVGHWRENRHLKSLARREEALKDVTVTNWKHLPRDLHVESAFLCIGSVVIASDYFKTFAAGLKNLIGGHLRTLETLLMRARREAILRMTEDAKAKGASIILNARFETMMIMRTMGRNKGGPMVEMLSYGTAIRLAPTPPKQGVSEPDA